MLHFSSHDDLLVDLVRHEQYDQVLERVSNSCCYDKDKFSRFLFNHSTTLYNQVINTRHRSLVSSCKHKLMVFLEFGIHYYTVVGDIEGKLVFQRELIQEASKSVLAIDDSGDALASLIELIVSYSELCSQQKYYLNAIKAYDRAIHLLQETPSLKHLVKDLEERKSVCYQAELSSNHFLCQRSTPTPPLPRNLTSAYIVCITKDLYYSSHFIYSHRTFAS